MRVVERITLACILLAQAHTVAAADSSCDAADSSCRAPKDVDETDSAVMLALSVSHRSGGLPTFAAFIQEHGRTYEKGSEEYEMRKSIYTQRVEYVQRQNRDHKRRWDAGVNHMSDRTEEELAQLRGSRPMKAGASKSFEGLLMDQVSNVVLPEEKTWTHLDAVSAESNQEACGSCWAVTTATTLSANAQASGHGKTFSAQELVSCVPNPHKCGGKGGCQGSTVELAMNWIMEKGLDTLDGTPYLAKNAKCKKTSLLSHDGDDDHDHYDRSKLQDMIAVGFHEATSLHAAGKALGLRGWERLPENEYEPLMRAVAATGPVAVSVGAGEWHSYRQGVFDGCNKDSEIDHAVTLVGYGKDKDSNDKFWLIKNSWGNMWGEHGSIRLLRHEGSNAHCGTDHNPKVGTACDDGHAPKSVKVCGMCGILYDSVVPHFHKKSL